MTVHFSVDDVGNSLRWLNLNDANTVFASDFFSNLRTLYHQFNVKTDLYVLELAEFLLLVQNENMKLDECRDYIRFGFHGNKIAFRKDYHYVSEYILFQKACKQANINQADIVRLHNWYATDEQKCYLQKQGLKCLLYPNDDCLKYNKDDCFEHLGLKHQRTHIRIEHLPKITKELLAVGKEHIEVFTHEPHITIDWDKIRRCMEVYYASGYKFI